MKRFLLVLLMVVVIYPLSYGQFKVRYGSLAPEDIDLKECAFDPDAPAAVLVEEGYSDYTDQYELMTYHHKRVKILKEAGKSYADVSILFRSKDNFQYVDQIQAMVINVGENGMINESPVDKKLIYTKKINNYLSEVSFAFPNVKVGSILEYRYRIYSKNYGGLEDWFFQSEIPVYRSSFMLKVVPAFEITYLVQHNKKYDVVASPSAGTNSVYFEMKNIPGLSDEPYMDARKDYIQKVIFQITKYESSFGIKNYMSTWNEVTKELYDREDFGRQLRIKMGECNEYIRPAVGEKSDFEKMKFIHKYVLQNTTWNGYQGVVTSDGIKNLWKKKTGTAAEINLLLINLLDCAGLDVLPMLVSERDNGRINKKSPFIDQFNSVYAVVTIGDKKYYLDGTDKYTPCHLIPYSILNTSAFIAHLKKGGIVDIEEPEARYRDVVSIDAQVNEDGAFAGSVLLMSKDYARSSRLSYFKGNKEEEYIEKYLMRGMANMTLENLKSENEDNDTLPYKQTFDYKTHIQSTGDYSFININLFTGFENNPFIINDRFSTVNFGYKKALSFNCAVKLADNFKVDALPKNLKLKNEDGSVVFTREVFKDDKANRLLVRIKVDINKSLFTLNEYGELKEFYKKMIDLLNEPVVLKRS